MCSVTQGRQDSDSAAGQGQAKLWREYKQRGWLCAGNQSAAVCGTGELSARERPAGLRGMWGPLVHGSHAAALCQRGWSELCTSAPESTLLLRSRRMRLFQILYHLEIRLFFNYVFRQQCKSCFGSDQSCWWQQQHTQ